MKTWIVLVAVALVGSGCAVGTAEDEDNTPDIPKTRNATVVVPTDEVETPPNKPVQLREEGVFQNPLDPVTAKATK